MRNLVFFMAIALLAFGCSTPKSYYAFSTYKYQSKNAEKDLKKLEPKGVDHESLQVSVDEKLLNAPVPQLEDNEISMKVLDKLSNANPVIEEKIAEINSKYSTLALSEKGDKAVKREIRKDFKDLRREIKKEVKKNPEEYKSFLKELLPQSESGKSQLVALLLVLLVGGLSIHRFYLGHIWQGIAQLVLFIVGIVFWPVLIAWGIWWLIDLIRIITGDLKPKNGEYGSTL